TGALVAVVARGAVGLRAGCALAGRRAAGADVASVVQRRTVDGGTGHALQRLQVARLDAVARVGVVAVGIGGAFARAGRGRGAATQLLDTAIGSAGDTVIASELGAS